jgi:hypothetical protein
MDSIFNESKFSYDIHVKNIREEDMITIKFIMPHREGVYIYNDFEMPGRTAAYANISLSNVMNSI